MIFEISLVLLALLLFRELYWKRQGLPPGPFPIPVAGNMLSILYDFPGYDAYQKWKNEYGSIYTFWLGPWPIVNVNDYKTIQDMFVIDGDNYADRASLGKLTVEYRGGEYGIVESNGLTWKEQRRFALHTLRDFGLGKAAMEERILVEVDWLLNKLEEDSKTGATAPIKYMERTVGSVINDVLFGYRFDDERIGDFLRIRELMEEQNKAQTNPIALLAFFSETLRTYIPYARKQYELAMKVRDEMFDFFKKNIQQHRETIDYEVEESTDFCEAYLKEMHRRREESDTTFHEKQFINVVLDLWLAGMETTASTMSWGICLLLNYPEVLRKMHNEFDTVIGEERFITLKDKPNLPYCQAVISEVQRWGNIVSQNLLRRVTNDVVVDGKLIKAGTIVAPQISVLLYDPEVFPNPHTFDPNHFLDDSGKYVNNKYFLPFSVGKRQCPGEGLAKMELFLFFSNLTHRFEIEPQAHPPFLERKLSAGGKPLPFHCTMRKRIAKIR